jgi:hypothetical protein
MLQLRDGQQRLQQEISDLRESKHETNAKIDRQGSDLTESIRETDAKLAESIRVTNAGPVQQIQQVDARMNFIQDLLLWIFGALAAGVGGFFLFWQKAVNAEGEDKAPCRAA